MLLNCFSTFNLNKYTKLLIVDSYCHLFLYLLLFLFVFLFFWLFVCIKLTSNHREIAKNQRVNCRWWSWNSNEPFNNNHTRNQIAHLTHLFKRFFVSAIDTITRSNWVFHTIFIYFYFSLDYHRQFSLIFNIKLVNKNWMAETKNNEIKNRFVYVCDNLSRKAHTFYT